MIRLWSMSAQVGAELQVDQQHGLAAAAAIKQEACALPQCLQQLLHHGVRLEQEDVLYFPTDLLLVLPLRKPYSTLAKSIKQILSWSAPRVARPSGDAVHRS